MKKRNQKFNPKRKLLKLEDCHFDTLLYLSRRAQYGGNPEHKQNPGDFNLTPLSGPRAGKSLCDSVQVFTRKEALTLLRRGIKHGFVSDRWIDSWPKTVWSVMDDGTPLEAQLDATGSYHGYPLQEEDPFYEKVIEQCKIRRQYAQS